MSVGYSFFAGANSENGFVSFYDSIDSDVENTAVFSIIGGPGTGKSSLIKKLCGLSEKYGYTCEKYFCSSDPGSLDAIRLVSADARCKIVICDATAPHPRELSTPGATGRLIDLSAYWNCDKLIKEKEYILSLQNRKREYYISAYRYLKIAGLVLREAVRVRKQQYDLFKLRRDISDYAYFVDRPCVIKRPIRCISMFGEKTLDNKGYSAKIKLNIEDEIDCYIVSDVLLENTNCAWVSPHPVVNSFFDEVYIPISEICISSVSGENCEKFNIDRYIYNSEDSLLKKLIASYRSYIDMAIASLSEAKVCHFQLERIYGSAMDFAGKEENDLRVVKDVSLLMA